MNPSCDLDAKSRSKTSLGLISLAIGIFADLQEMFEEYAQLYPESQFPDWAPRSIPSSSEGSRVCLPSFCAAT